MIAAVLHIICLAASVAVVVSLVVGAVALAGHLLEDVDTLGLRCIHCGGVVCGVVGCPCGRACG